MSILQESWAGGEVGLERGGSDGDRGGEDITIGGETDGICKGRGTGGKATGGIGAGLTISFTTKISSSSLDAAAAALAVGF